MDFVINPGSRMDPLEASLRGETQQEEEEEEQEGGVLWCGVVLCGAVATGGVLVCSGHWCVLTAASCGVLLQEMVLEVRGAVVAAAVEPRSRSRVPLVDGWGRCCSSGSGARKIGLVA
jgi:hypothetical protein